MTPATVSTPTAPTAVTVSTPRFWRKRAVTAKPPPGAATPTNDVATCTPMFGPNGSRSDNEPASASAAPTYVTTDSASAATTHHQFAFCSSPHSEPTPRNCGISDHNASATTPMV